jgi:hypothetical protein
VLFAEGRKKEIEKRGGGGGGVGGHLKVHCMLCRKKRGKQYLKYIVCFAERKRKKIYQQYIAGLCCAERKEEQFWLLINIFLIKKDIVCFVFPNSQMWNTCSCYGKLKMKRNEEK